MGRVVLCHRERYRRHQPRCTRRLGCGRCVVMRDDGPLSWRRCDTTRSHRHHRYRHSHSSTDTDLYTSHTLHHQPLFITAGSSTHAAGSRRQPPPPSRRATLRRPSWPDARTEQIADIPREEYTAASGQPSLYTVLLGRDRSLHARPLRCNRIRLERHHNYHRLLLLRHHLCATRYPQRPRIMPCNHPKRRHRMCISTLLVRM